MRLLVDENIPSTSVAALRSAGHDVVAVAETCPGAPDAELLRVANQETRILLTFDRDFGALVYREGAAVPAGVILLRMVPQTPDEPAKLVSSLAERPELEFEGRFTVVDRERVRQRRLP
jgi:predicted nuclease of predicted toxin-antitoxin system